ncbi:PAAR domain-containing protein [Paracidovorax citrulli]
MTRPFIVLGDRTDHDGEVITASGTAFIHGKGVARVGDRVTCRKTGHDRETSISTGDPTVLIDGRAAARHGDETCCGAILLSSQRVTGID